MKLYKKAILTFTAGVLISAGTCYLGNKYAILGLDDGDYSKNTEVSIPYKQCIDENTVIETIYNYNDGYSDISSALPSDYMVGFDKEQLQEEYRGWQIESFSPYKVVFSKTVDEESPQHYVIKEYKGYLCVFYRKSGAVKEMTSTPVDSLSNEERERYVEGVEIDGDDELARVMEGIES